jgi:hypothetical protein
VIGLEPVMEIFDLPMLERRRYLAMLLKLIGCLAIGRFLSVVMLDSGQCCRSFGALPRKRRAVLPLRRSVSMKSMVQPVWSMARNDHFHSPLSRMQVSSTPLGSGRPCRATTRQFPE